MNKVYKSVLGAAVATLAVSASLTPTIVNAWGDSNYGRPSYTVEQINSGAIDDKIVFNSISNGWIGDEKNFVGARLVSSDGEFEPNTIHVKDGETYTVRLYVHNNNRLGENAVAKGVTASFDLPRPKVVGKSHTIIGYLNSTNADPVRYWDEVTFAADEDVYLEYVAGSARFTNKKLGEVALPDEVITSGATLGYDQLNGEIPGCFDFSGVVTIKIKVHALAKVNKTVRLKGTTTWSESVNAKVGDEVEYRIEFVNRATYSVKDVVIRDILPSNVEYVANSTYLYNYYHQDGVLLSSNDLTTTGVNIGDYAPNGNAEVRFTAKVVDNGINCGDNQLVNWANATANGATYKDDASVIVNKSMDDPTCKYTPPTPPVIVDTGAGTIVTGTIGVGAMVTTLGYYVASRKKLM